MLFLTTVLLLTAVLHHSLGEEEEDEDEEGENVMPTGGVSTKMMKFIIDKHNEIRRKVKPTAANMLQMVWNEKVAEQALRWAEQCILAHGPLASRKLGDMVCGENIFQTNYFKDWKEIIKSWVAGKKFFRYGSVPTDPTKNIFGYTQMIWYNSYQVGCAVSYCENITFPFMYICHYCPGGNLMTKIPTPYTKGPTCGHCPDSCENKLCTNPCKYTDTVPNCKEMRKSQSCKKKIMAKICKATCKCKKEIV